MSINLKDTVLVISELDVYSSMSIGRSPKKGVVSRSLLYPIISAYGDKIGAEPDISFGVNSFIKRKFTDPYFNLVTVLSFMSELYEFTKGVNYFKSRSLNYISENHGLEVVTNGLIRNAKFMIDLMGIDFFSRSNWAPNKRKTFYRAEIPQTPFYLSVKGGSGAGTFSLDFALGAINAKASDNVSGELWRSGYDTEFLPDGSFRVRIIRTGSGVKPDTLAWKGLQFEEFRDLFKMTPARALAILVVNCAIGHSPDSIVALSSEGAKILSTLPKRRDSYNYSLLFNRVGFEKNGNPFWLELKPEILSNRIEPGKRERSGFEKILEAFYSLRNMNGNSAPPLLVSI